MLDIELLKVAELPEITECIDEIYDTYKVLDTVLTKFKDSIKISGEVIVSQKYTIQTTLSNQLVPAVAIEEIVKRYPIEEYPDMYAIKLSALAGDIIKETELLCEKPIKSVKFKKNE